MTYLDPFRIPLAIFYPRTFKFVANIVDSVTFNISSGFVRFVDLLDF